jgi:nicotinate-nucleotide pyrophosphorylase (carboxylating)
LNNLNKIISDALREDVPSKDITTQLTVTNKEKVHAKIISKERGVLCGLEMAKAVFLSVDPSLRIKRKFKDGTIIKNNQSILEIYGKKSSILTAERTALNFLGLATGIATKNNYLSKKIKKFKSKVCCTRKTIPNLRNLQKYAVLVGGGTNNRMNLSDEIFVKDNHLANTKNIALLLQSVIKKNTSKKIITVEVDTIAQLKAIKHLKINRILFDNMQPSQIKKGIQLLPKNTQTEASGNINEKNIVSYAKTGVGRISMGSLTHTISNFDFSLEIKK